MCKNQNEEKRKEITKLSGMTPQVGSVGGPDLSMGGEKKEGLNFIFGAASVFSS